MPALVKSSVGSLAGTSDDECTRRCPLLSKKRRNFSRISEPVGITLYCKCTLKKPLQHRETRKRRLWKSGHLAIGRSGQRKTLPRMNTVGADPVSLKLPQILSV